MPKFDEAYVDYVVAKFRELPDDANPQWGQFTKPQVIGHLIGAVEYTMGRKGEAPIVGKGLRPKLALPLILAGLAPIPKNVKFRDKDGAVRPPIMSEGDLDRLDAVMREFIEFAKDNSRALPPHPFFGRLDAKKWSKFHVFHFKHHMKQFGIA